MKKRSRNGFTLMELVVAISLGLFVSTLIFAAYTDVFKGFRKQAQRADRIRTMVRLKQGLDHSFRRADLLTAVSARKLTYTERGNQIEHTIAFYDSTVYCDNSVLQSKVRDFTFTASDKLSEENFRLVRWEALLAGGGWVGGVGVVRDGKK
jgi:prepilin-type N-terminal cleavage/methylation domain-containing protein